MDHFDLEWKSTLRIVESTLKIVEPTLKNRIHSQKSDSNHYFEVDSTIIRSGFNSKLNDP